MLKAICARLGHAATLLDGDLPPDVADGVAATGLSLLPGPGEVGSRCTCPDGSDPRKHSAAVFRRADRPEHRRTREQRLAVHDSVIS
ncbi:MAG: hypothetical protein ACM30G_13920 [Micromonosporaceae bacterium]